MLRLEMQTSTHGLRPEICHRGGGGGRCFERADTPVPASAAGAACVILGGLRDTLAPDEGRQGTALEGYLAIPVRTESGVLLGHPGFMDNPPLPDTRAKPGAAVSVPDGIRDAARVRLII